jgi:predicted nucleotidyltransferase component of viral defense system
MKDQIRSLLSRQNTPIQSTLIVREYLQARILEALQRSGGFRRWAFLGGTALRFLYQLPRFSEDLDFSRTEPSGPGSAALEEFSRLITRVQRLFEAETYQVEVDTNPPAGASTETSLVRRHVLLNLLHYDKPSLFSGILHALIARPYTKGRDVYDLLWYLSDRTWPEPNFQLLRTSLEQTGPKLDDEAVKDWRSSVLARLREAHWQRVVLDVTPFLERAQDIELLTRENLLALLGSPRSPK